MARNNTAEALNEYDFFEEDNRFANYGNLAPSYAPRRSSAAPQYEPEPEITTRPAARPERHPELIRSKLFFLLFGSVIAVGAVFIVLMYASNFGKSQKLIRLQNELLASEELTAVMEADAKAAEKALSLPDLFNFATDELGMTTADGSHIIVVNVRPQSYTTDYITGGQAQERITFHWFGR